MPLIWKYLHRSTADSSFPSKVSWWHHLVSHDSLFLGEGMSGVLFGLLQGLGRRMKARFLSKKTEILIFLTKILLLCDVQDLATSQKGTSPSRETKATGSPTGPLLELNWEGTVYEASYCERSFQTYDLQYLQTWHLVSKLLLKTVLNFPSLFPVFSHLKLFVWFGQVTDPCHSKKRAISRTWTDFSKHFDLTSQSQGKSENANHWPCLQQYFHAHYRPSKGFSSEHGLFELGDWGMG